jgi:Flp pilus assembly protein TadD
LPVPRDSAKTRRNQPQQLAYDGLNLLADGDVAGASLKFNAALRLTPTEANFHLLNAVAYHLDLLNGNGAAVELARQLAWLFSARASAHGAAGLPGRASGFRRGAAV